MADAKEVGEATDAGKAEMGATFKDNAGGAKEQVNPQMAEVFQQEVPGESAAARARRLRPKAEDMFASDGE